ncbi:hypothetical protein PGT21_021150 [Puccinia graminis f. sp. tritici]|uniref:Uncharacterized protein n=1 Tax=Puccinia graminis f. sp. tritici TaxID=56615 RepID=A0A5B0LL46_PUCGR|nr:hypothetical protein PGT21_021150 [Puccinia graminis f. sp. tritici]
MLFLKLTAKPIIPAPDQNVSMRSNYLLKSSNYLIKRSLNDGESSSICTICQEPLPKDPWEILHAQFVKDLLGTWNQNSI